ncbi:metallophosphoesterase family protein [Naumannella cuiyingiana]|uniref:Calcineurin-like phosphoesterase domain-containing protein n=1 Tax=Naumannella cuiyingiana TaxID=1347891 RepID=A0A7Z0D9N6_9ACTN|nr:metallophosphoesterase family protein [Naumannella cuiyingiana]NYI71326.1 hypothetical protein [Naumannella cuiyingiana]
MSDDILPPGSPLTVGRRGLLVAGGLGALGAAAIAGATPAEAAPVDLGPSTTRAGKKLQFSGGKFKIIQFNDTQDDHLTDKRTVQTMERIIDDEHPDFVVINGDVITGGPRSLYQVKQALNNVVLPMESRRIPWAVTFGNHDEDSFSASGVDEAEMLDFYRSYDYNLNGPNIDGLTGTSNTHLIIESGQGGAPAYGIWLIDSGRYAPGRIAGQDFTGYPTWDWVRMDQVAWYRDESTRVEQELGRKLRGLLFQHIALWEHRFMWWGGVDTRGSGAAARGKSRHGIVGERNEDECPGPFNSGLFSAILERGDVDGVFVGHDHVNSYLGNYYGVRLGYSPGTGFGTYGLSGSDRNRLRGGRVFDITEDDGDTSWTSEVRFASEFGIDLTANDQPMPAFLLPEEIGSGKVGVQVRLARPEARPGDKVTVRSLITGAGNNATGWVVVFVDGVPQTRIDLAKGRADLEITVPDDASGELGIEVAYGGDKASAATTGTARLRVR